MTINRVWAMPSKHTFTIPPIAQLLKKYVPFPADGWIDPFAGENSPAEITNDLNANKPAKFHLSAYEFLLSLKGIYKGLLFDPPYSLRQLKECYSEIGLEVMQDETNFFPTRERKLIPSLIQMNGIVISFGWNSQGMGKNSGFEIIEILLVAHGRGHNDTIVTVERKFQSNMF